MADLWQEILGERAGQDAKHGGPDNDDTLVAADWVAILTKHVGRVYGLARFGRLDMARRQLVRVAAVAVAAIESWDRLHAPPESSFEELRALPDTPASMSSPGPVETLARECLT